MNKHGFVNVVAMDTMLVLFIVGIIAAIAIPQYVSYKNRPLNEQAKAHAYQAYKASQAFFQANPKGRPTEKDIEKFGYQGSPDILIMMEGGKENLVIRTEHRKGKKTYRIDAKGDLSD